MINMKTINSILPPLLQDTTVQKTNRYVNVDNEDRPVVKKTVNGSPKYLWLSKDNRFFDYNGTEYYADYPLDEVTVKYDPKTGGQINKAAPDYWRQYGQRRMQQTAGNVDKVIMGTVGAATAPLWLPEIY